MSCLFCNSFNHLSQNCNVYVSDKSRKRIFWKKKVFDHGLNLLSFRKFQRGVHKFKKQCYICFTVDHYTFLCPERNNELEMFIPAIDENLIPRFLLFLNPYEQFSLACTLPLAFRFISIKNLIVHDQLNTSLYWYFPRDAYAENVIVINKSISFFSEELRSVHAKQIYYSLNSKVVINKARSIQLERVAITSQNLFLLITSYIKILKFKEVFVTPKLKFVQILERIPNIEVLEFDDTNIEVGSAWLEELMEHKKGNNFRRLKLQINDVNFDNLAVFIQTKCIKRPVFDLDITSGNNTPNFCSTGKSCITKKTTK